MDMIHINQSPLGVNGSRDQWSYSLCCGSERAGVPSHRVGSGPTPAFGKRSATGPGCAHALTCGSGCLCTANRVSNRRNRTAWPGKPEIFTI